MPGVLIQTVTPWELPKKLDDLRKEGYLDAKMDLRNLPRYLVIRVWRKGRGKKRVGRPTKVRTE